MIENQIRHLAVMEEGSLVGVLSMRDILKKK
jgi:signal-transduction protein with cAMP-binding, CBS, and nucleotidyltransferase domain